MWCLQGLPASKGESDGKGGYIGEGEGEGDKEGGGGGGGGGNKGRKREDR